MLCITWRCLLEAQVLPFFESMGFKLPERKVPPSLPALLFHPIHPVCKLQLVTGFVVAFAFALRKTLFYI